MLELDVTSLPPRLHVGTSSFSTPDWCGIFYPANARPRDFLAHYATRLRTVEIDATWYAIPDVRTVRGWAERIPEDFIIAAKVPKVITHERYLENCEGELTEFLKAMDALGEKRGPLLLQFPYVPRGKDAEEWATGADFRRRLGRFLPLLGGDRRFAIEIRNHRWIGPPLLDLVRGRNLTLALIDYYTMPPLSGVAARVNVAVNETAANQTDGSGPAGFGYVRFLGDHRMMDDLVARAIKEKRRTREWSELIVDRSREIGDALPAIRDLLDRRCDVFVYFNNHYAGFAPGSIDLFIRLWRERFGQTTLTS